MIPLKSSGMRIVLFALLAVISGLLHAQTAKIKIALSDR
jgi:hypothetical protein